uniref:Pentatricopeptide repeat-containing protein n=1 Tax=Solanum tuberosum TaxID=4113 RepID=M1BF75_SOLTU
MDTIFSLSPSPPPFSAAIHTGNHHSTTVFSSLRKSSSSSPEKIPLPYTPKFTKKPLKHLLNSTAPPSLSNKLWLSKKLSPPPPPTPPPTPPPFLAKNEEMQKRVENKEKGRIFVGNLPLWIKEEEVAEFFRQFGAIKNVILIKGNSGNEKNMGFGFLKYEGPIAEKAAMKAVEFDGVEFHGRVLTVKLDDGRRLKEKIEERNMWHEAMEGSGRDFKKVLETQPENWQAVVWAFERIKKVLCLLEYFSTLLAVL